MTRPDDFDFESDARDRRADRLDRWAGLAVAALVILVAWGACA